VAYNTLLVILFWQTSRKFPALSLLNASFGRNGLFLFLISNLMTGATNLTMHTLYASDITAFAVLSIYLLSVSAIAIFLHINRINLKFW
jgi:glucosaminylphosphatidylinositol acyltransferase